MECVAKKFRTLCVGSMKIFLEYYVTKMVATKMSVIGYTVY